MSAGILLYRCRKCKWLDHVPVPDLVPALAERIAEGRSPTTIHKCSPGHYGVADLLGGWVAGAEEVSEHPPEDSHSVT